MTALSIEGNDPEPRKIRTEPTRRTFNASTANGASKTDASMNVRSRGQIMRSRARLLEYGETGNVNAGNGCETSRIDGKSI